MRGILSLLLNALILITLFHAVGSWIPTVRESNIYRKVDGILSPLLNPIRSVIKPVGGLDFSPAVLILILYLIKQLLKV
ncbi:protein of unknown function YGGT [Thermocrinis albus DSM 14484]|uniref:YggT family protein n=1 Tax=Thermocrinis albus (strain DSM 14484 / JCM 11386 / HI 11/12) TaxID=638303 RepID=D3SQD6_THEAH|nr:YggT family protein [Thermocrinis albus]ADC89373.1 protein of unknown function YGGT [Thermocrinis albus DSM 14484]